jgi:anti-sigma factor RsiW
MTQCPRLKDISAYIDGALGEPARQAFASHAAGCPLCAGRLRDFLALRSAFHAWRDTRCDIDLAALLDERLAQRPGARRAPERQARPPLWQLLPQGLGAVGVLAAGIYFGMLFAGSAAALRPAAMAVFDAAPPGALCAGRCLSGRR